MLDAVTSVLERAGRPLRVRDVRAAVEELLGTPVPFSSVNEALSTHASGRDERFRRVRYGVYEHRSQRALVGTVCPDEVGASVLTKPA